MMQKAKVPFSITHCKRLLLNLMKNFLEFPFYMCHVFIYIFNINGIMLHFLIYYFFLFTQEYILNNFPYQYL